MMLGRGARMAVFGWGRPMLRGAFPSAPRFYGVMDKWRDLMQKVRTDEEVKATEEKVKKVTRRKEKKVV
jgi:hypothetical protein